MIGYSDLVAAAMTEARGWLGTPWFHQGRRKGPRGGVDCVGFLRGVGLNSDPALLHDLEYDLRGYKRLPRGDELLQHMRQAGLVEIPQDQIMVADILAMAHRPHPKIGQARHVVVLSDLHVEGSIGQSLDDMLDVGGPGIIHSDRGVGKVIEHRFTREHRCHVVAAFRYPVLAAVAPPVAPPKAKAPPAKRPCAQCGGETIQTGCGRTCVSCGHTTGCG